jgi:hypothetical protein
MQAETHAFLGRNGHRLTTSPFRINAYSVSGPQSALPCPTHIAAAVSAFFSIAEKPNLAPPPPLPFLSAASGPERENETTWAGSETSSETVYSRRVQSTVSKRRDEASAPSGCQRTEAIEGEPGREW